MIGRLLSLARITGQGSEHTLDECADAAPVAEFLDPYTAGQEYRRQYATTPTYGQTAAATGADSSPNSQAGLQAWKGSVR